MNKKILQGLFFAPSVVASSLKTAILTAKVLEKLGYKVDPKWDEKRTDIVQTISFGDGCFCLFYSLGNSLSKKLQLIATV